MQDNHSSADECDWFTYTPAVVDRNPSWNELVMGPSIGEMRRNYLTSCDPGDEDDGVTHPDGWKGKEEKK